MLVSKTAATAGARRNRTLTEANVPPIAVPSFGQRSNAISAEGSETAPAATGRGRLRCEPFRVPQ